MRDRVWAEVCLLGHRRLVGKMDWDRRFGSFDLDVWTGHDWAPITVGMSALFTTKEMTGKEVAREFRHADLPEYDTARAFMQPLPEVPAVPGPMDDEAQRPTVDPGEDEPSEPSESSLRVWPETALPGLFVWYWWPHTKLLGHFEARGEAVIFKAQDGPTYTVASFEVSREWLDLVDAEDTSTESTEPESAQTMPAMPPPWEDDDIPF